MSATSRLRRKWTTEEDSRLVREAELQASNSPTGTPSDWIQIASKIPGRTNKDCRKRWSKIYAGINKGTWDRAEDERLRKGIEMFGLRWTQVAEIVGSRHADQCAKRWQNSLDPSVDRSEWTQADDCRLLAAVDQHGQKWKKIAEEHLPRRSTNDLKNRYMFLIRKQPFNQPTCPPSEPSSLASQSCEDMTTIPARETQPSDPSQDSDSDCSQDDMDMDLEFTAEHNFNFSPPQNPINSLPQLQHSSFSSSSSGVTTPRTTYSMLHSRSSPPNTHTISNHDLCTAYSLIDPNLDLDVHSRHDTSSNLPLWTEFIDCDLSKKADSTDVSFFADALGLDLNKVRHMESGHDSSATAGVGNDTAAAHVQKLEYDQKQVNLTLTLKDANQQTVNSLLEFLFRERTRFQLEAN